MFWAVAFVRRNTACRATLKTQSCVKTQRDLERKLCATQSGIRSAFKALPGATVLVAVGAFGFQALGTAPTKELPVLKPIGPAPIQSRRLGLAGITGFGAFSHSLTEPQARWTPVIRGTTSDWINPKARVRVVGYNQTRWRALARRQPAATKAHRGRQNRRLGPPPRRAPWLTMSPAYCPP